MKISTLTGVLMRKFGAKEAVKIIKEAGYDCIDFSFFLIEKEKLMNDTEMAARCKALLEYAKELGIFFNQAHAPFPSSVGDEKEDAAIFQAIVKSMELASLMEIKTIVVHPKQHLRYTENKEVLKKINHEFFVSLIPYCEKYKIHVAVENMFQSENGRLVPGPCGDPDEFLEYLDGVCSPWIVGCLDVGHCSIVGVKPAKMIKTLGTRLKALHIQDGDMLQDGHMLPGLGKIDYDEIMEALSYIHYDGEFTLEADGFLKYFQKESDLEFLPEAAKFMAKRAAFLVKNR